MTSDRETHLVDVLSPAYGGLTVARLQGRVVLVRGAIPGERVRIRIEERKADYDTAAVHSVEEPSRHRIEPACRYFGDCGGCHLQYLSHAGQISLKEDVLRDCLRRIGGIEAELLPPLRHPDPWRYRVRAQFKVAGSSIGFYRRKTREVVDIDVCPLMTDEVNACLQVLRKALKNDPARGDPARALSEAHLTVGDRPVLLLRTRERSNGALRERRLLRHLAEAGVAGVFIQSADGRVHREGDSFTTFMLGGLQYTVSPLTFIQCHWTLNRAVVECLTESLRPLSGRRVLDLYAGAGNFSLPLCAEAGEVVAVESSPAAVRDGERNISLNRIANCRLVRSGAEDVVPACGAQALILDPPRAGLTGKALERVRSIGPERIVYVSCSPPTLSRDLRKLQEGYRIVSCRIVDFFPQTYHCETLAVLERRRGS